MHPGSSTGEVTISDNDSPVTVSVSSASCTEGEGDGYVTVWLTLSAPTEDGWSVAWGTSDGSATSGSDYTSASGTASFEPYATSASVSVAITDDSVAEDTETFSVSVSQGYGSSYGEVTIYDDDHAPEAEDDSAYTGLDYPVTVWVLNNDTDQDNDALSVTWAGEGSKGSVTYDSTSITYTPDADFLSGTDTFEYRVEDGHGNYDTGSVTITMVEVSDITLEWQQEDESWEEISEGDPAWWTDTLRWTADYSPGDPPYATSVDWQAKAWADRDNSAVSWTTFASASDVEPVEGDPGVGDWAIQPEFYFDGTSTQSSFCAVPASPRRQPIAKATLHSIIFTSNYQVEGKNGVKWATTYGSSGTDPAPADVDWWCEPPPTGTSRAIAQAKGTTLSLTARVKIEPAGVRYDLSGEDTDRTDCALNFAHALTQTSTGDWQDISMTAGDPLPDMITRLEEDVHWTIDLLNSSYDVVRTLELQTSSHEIFVTYHTPIAESTGGDNCPNCITDKRLRKAVQKAEGATDEFQAAKKIQDWLPTAGITWASTNKPGANDTDGIWGLLDGQKTGQCVEYAKLHEMILRQLGIAAEYRQIRPTTQAEYAAAQQVNYKAWTDPATNYQVGMVVLWLDFGIQGQADEGEGGVRVANGAGAVRFYTEDYAQAPTGRVVGVETTTKTAELDALRQLATGFRGEDFQKFQHYVTVSNLNPLQVQWQERWEDLPGG